MTRSRMNLNPTDEFAPRHIGPSPEQSGGRLGWVGGPAGGVLSDQARPASLRLKTPVHLPGREGRSGYLRRLRASARKNRVLKSFCGLGYHDNGIPSVIR